MKSFDWTNTSVDEQLRHVRSVKRDALNLILRKYDWGQHPETVLGWIAAQKGIALNSALIAFFNGDPWRFNYLPKRDVATEFRGVASLLDTLCQRINAGYYLPDATNLNRDGTVRLEAWLKNQRFDRRDHRSGRWVIEPEALEGVLQRQRASLEDRVRREAGQEPAAPANELAGAMRKGFSLKKLTGTIAG